MAIRTMLGTTKRSVKFGLIISFILAMVVQIVFCTTVVFVAQSHTSVIGHLIAKVFATAIIPLPLMLERFIISNKPADFYPPSVEEAATLSFNFLKNNLNKVERDKGDKLKSTLSVKNLSATFGDLHRHSSTNYINNGSLTEAYFEKVEESLADPYLYIVISNTGSPASEMIAMFTMKQFNHASLSFDKDLKTIISYNGGVNVYPPGLNPETVEAFHQNWMANSCLSNPSDSRTETSGRRRLNKLTKMAVPTIFWDWSRNIQFDLTSCFVLNLCIRCSVLLGYSILKRKTAKFDQRTLLSWIIISN